MSLPQYDHHKGVFTCWVSFKSKEKKINQKSQLLPFVDERTGFMLDCNLFQSVKNSSSGEFLSARDLP